MRPSSAGDIVAQHLANMNVTCDWADTLDFIVTMDPYFTEGAKWSDYLLPCTSRFEYDEPFGNVKAGYSQIVIQEKIIDPLFEARHRPVDPARAGEPPGP